MVSQVAKWPRQAFEKTGGTFLDFSSKKLETKKYKYASGF